MTCMMVCPQGAIAKAEGPGGAIYPVVDKGKCVDCGRCERVCPFLSGYLKTKPHGCIVGFTKEENIRSLCTAGGIFAALAASILAQSGAVYGAAYGQGFVCSHICVEEVGDLPKILGKKYAESQAAELFMNLKERLLNDQKWYCFRVRLSNSGAAQLSGRHTPESFVCAGELQRCGH